MATTGFGLRGLKTSFGGIDWDDSRRPAQPGGRLLNLGVAPQQAERVQASRGGSAPTSHLTLGGYGQRRVDTLANRSLGSIDRGIASTHSGVRALARENAIQPFINSRNEANQAFADADARDAAAMEAREQRMANMGRNPALEQSARRAAAGTYGAGTHAVSVNGSTDLGSMTGAEAAARVRANPRLAEGGVFGRNDREAAMQRNRDFIRSGRASMFGPRPATTKGILRMRNADLKGQELANQREANHLMAGNDRYAQDTIRQGNSLLAKLRGQELKVTRENNHLQHLGDLAKNANNNQSRQFAAMMQAFKEGGFDEEQLKRIEGILNKWGGGGGEANGGETAPAAAQAQPQTAPEEPDYGPPSHDLNDPETQAYWAKKGVGPKSWLKALRDSGGNTAPGPATEGTGQPAAAPGDFTDPAIVQSPEVVQVASEQPQPSTPSTSWKMIPIPRTPYAPSSPMTTNSSLNSLSNASAQYQLPQNVNMPPLHWFADPMRSDITRRLGI